MRHHPKGLKSVVLSNTLSSSKEYVASFRAMQRAMGEEVWLPIEKHEREGTTDDPEYGKAIMTFFGEHMCRVKPFPKEIEFTLSQQAGDGEKVWAAIPLDRRKKFFDEWCIDDRIHLMNVLALLINGEFDYMTDVVCGPFLWNMDRVKWVKFAHSSHTPMWEERERYMDVVGDFLRGVEQ
ncbi:unnamed protein product [Peniophora sp. CBMAI 1063]|nr:unnamed protein product [Peniophora sp. CBMAI 1063]